VAPPSRNQRLPTACDAPTAIPASSLVNPCAIRIQNSRSTSRRSDGAPGDFIGDLPVNSFIHPAGLPINTSEIKVLRRQVESAQYTAIHYSQRLADEGAVASVGSKGDSYDNEMVEAFNSLYKAEMIRHQGPWRGIDDVEIATAEYIDRYNHRRLHGQLGLIPPVEHETAHATAAGAAARIDAPATVGA